MIYYLTHVLILICAWGLYVGGVFAWTGIILLLGIIPVFEMGLKSFSVPSERFKSRLSDFSADFSADFSVLLTTPILFLFLILSFYQISHSKNLLELTGFILSTGVVMGGFGITSAHELVHRRQSWQRAFGVCNLIYVNFAYWGLEHVFGHHKYVATPEDPATARKNEPLYAFWFRNYFHGLQGAINISQKKVITYWLITFLISLLLFLIGGSKLLLSWWAISALAITLLLTVDYIEHYGLVRPKNQDGFYTATKPFHSWDTSSVITNSILFNLGYHAHHHHKATVPFYDLGKYETARKMPFGYPAMVLMALLPFIYIPVMNKRLEQ